MFVTMRCVSAGGQVMTTGNPLKKLMLAGDSV